MWCCQSSSISGVEPTLPVDPTDERDEARASQHVWDQAQHVFNSRCVVCHGCYDAPCQLKLGRFEGIVRGAHRDPVYAPQRLTAAEPTRLMIDAASTEQWRSKGFNAVLQEDPDGNPEVGVLLRMLALKRDNPGPGDASAASAFTFDIDREQVCPTERTFDEFASEHPTWGMPYALPGLTIEEEQSLRNWVLAGAPHSPPPAPTREVSEQLSAWETYLNDPSEKRQLVARYVYEHLFTASLYVPQDTTRFFRLVRSKTPPGSPVVEIATRRPIDPPGAPHVYYRLVGLVERPLAKTHMPYAFGEDRLRRVKQLFDEPAYDVEKLPGYEPETATNPMRTFAQLPVESRYRFMLDEAEFSLMAFIKGPVCHGQTALSVIRDRFWIAFVDPSVRWRDEQEYFLASNRAKLDLPGEAGSNALGLAWLDIADKHGDYLARKRQFLESHLRDAGGIDTRIVWDGGHNDDNAALTVFRHLDSATVVEGWVGEPPLTAWLIDYPLLERIHYLLVADFDVFGNVGHQLTTRLYMDFLRMEGEHNFLLLMPKGRRQHLANQWYRGLEKDDQHEITSMLTSLELDSNVRYATSEPEREIWEKLSRRLSRSRSELHDASELPAPARKIPRAPSEAASLMPEMTVVSIGDDRYFTILRDSAHSNVTELFNEQERRTPERDALTVVPHVVGAYPNLFLHVEEEALADFTDALAKMRTSGDFEALFTRYGVSRWEPGFWAHIDRVHEAIASRGAVEAGLLDLNRLTAH